MKLDGRQINLIKKQNIVVLSTSDNNGQPRAIFVEANKVAEDEIIITDNEMKMSKKNILENNKVFILTFNKDYSQCLKITGTAKYYPSGKYFEFVKNLPENKNFHPNGAVVVKIKKIIELK